MTQILCITYSVNHPYVTPLVSVIESFAIAFTFTLPTLWTITHLYLFFSRGSWNLWKCIGFGIYM